MGDTFDMQEDGLLDWNGEAIWPVYEINPHKGKRGPKSKIRGIQNVLLRRGMDTGAQYEFCKEYLKIEKNQPISWKAIGDSIQEDWVAFMRHVKDTCPKL